MLAKVLGRQVRPLHLADEETEAAKQRGAAGSRVKARRPERGTVTPQARGRSHGRLRPSPSLRFAVRNGGW